MYRSEKPYSVKSVDKPTTCGHTWLKLDLTLLIAVKKETFLINVVGSRRLSLPMIE
jgi:hypothetical protein